MIDVLIKSGKLDIRRIPWNMIMAEIRVMLLQAKEYRHVPTNYQKLEDRSGGIDSPSTALRRNHRC